MKIKKAGKNRILCGLCSLAIVVSSFQFSGVNVYAAETNKLTIEQAKALALVNSSKIDSLEAKVTTQEAKLKSATKKIALKQKNRSTFRYSPLLNIKFPTSASGSTLYDEEIKPIQIQTEIDKLNHQVSDQKLEEYKKVEELFVKIVSMQDRIEFNNKRISSYETTIKKNKSRVLLGEAKQADIDTMEAKVKEINTSISNDTSTLEAAKKKLSQTIGLDVTTQYTFENPYVKSEIPRSALDELKQYTLDNDQTYYEACIDETEALTALNTYVDIIKNNFGSKYNTIAPYINASLSGTQIDKKGFKKAYDTFLNDIDSPWQGDYTIRLLFVKIKIPKEWFKGEVDGIRYIEDDPYALMDLALDYSEKRITKGQVEEDILDQVEDNFNTYVSTKKAYLNYVDQVKTAKVNLDKDSVSNRLGELTYEEYQSSQNSYETLQNDMLQSLADYSNILIEFDRLTCGAVSAYLSGNGANVFAAGSGTSYIDEEVTNGAYCYVQPIAQQQAFVMTVVIPDDFDVNVTDFELWINSTQVGGRTSVNGQLRHLWIDTQNTETNAFLRMFDGDTAICDCPIDPEKYSNALTIISDYKVTHEDGNVVGTYTVKASGKGNYSIMNVTIADGEKTAYYKLKLDGDYINGDEKIDVKKDFKYLGILTDSLDDIEIEYYDESGSLLYTGYFDTIGLKLRKNLE